MTIVGMIVFIFFIFFLFYIAEILQQPVMCTILLYMLSDHCNVHRTIGLLPLITYEDMVLLYVLFAL